MPRTWFNLNAFNGRRRATVLVAALSVVAATPCLLALDEQDDAAKSPTLDDLGFMAGTWSGTIFGGPIVETWAKPDAGAMIGMSRMGHDGARAMYEFMLIEEKDGAPTMFLRHFRQHLTTKESEPMAFRLNSVEDKTAVFESPDKKHSFTKITYSRPGKDELHVKLEGEREGHPMKVESRLKRVGGR